MALSRPFKEDRLALPLSTPLSPPGDRWCEVLDFVPAGSVSSVSTFQSFRFQEQLDQQMLFSCLCGNITVMFDRTSKTQFSVHRFRVDSFFFIPVKLISGYRVNAPIRKIRLFVHAAYVSPTPNPPPSTSTLFCPAFNPPNRRDISPLGHTDHLLFLTAAPSDHM